MNKLKDTRYRDILLAQWKKLSPENRQKATAVRVVGDKNQEKSMTTKKSTRSREIATTNEDEKKPLPSFQFCFFAGST